MTSVIFEIQRIPENDRRFMQLWIKPMNFIPPWQINKASSFFLLNFGFWVKWLYKFQLRLYYFAYQPARVEVSETLSLISSDSQTAIFWADLLWDFNPGH